MIILSAELTQSWTESACQVAVLFRLTELKSLDLVKFLLLLSQLEML